MSEPSRRDYSPRAHSPPGAFWWSPRRRIPPTPHRPRLPPKRVRHRPTPCRHFAFRWKSNRPRPAKGARHEASAREFPVSTGIAGVLMRLRPGALRELHWHANAAEWAYVIKGPCRVTTIDPQGHCEIADFGRRRRLVFPARSWPLDPGHRPEDCLFVLIFDNGYFSEFGTFSITDWIGHVPAEVLAKNFAVPAATFANFPKKEVYIAKGPVPPPLPADPAPGSLNRRTLTHAIACWPATAGAYPWRRPCGWCRSANFRSPPP